MSVYSTVHSSYNLKHEIQYIKYIVNSTVHINSLKLKNVKSQSIPVIENTQNANQCNVIYQLQMQIVTNIHMYVKSNMYCMFVNK